MSTKQIIRRGWNILRNRYSLCIFIAVFYVFWVLWLGNYWFLAGLIILFDSFFTRFVNWRFWRKRKSSDKKYKFSTEVIDSLIIAILLAVFIRTFFLEAYMIPTSSMEKTLNVGDYIFVSKLRYGPRLPMTPVTLPFTHNILPFTVNSNSFVTWLKFPYRRLSGTSRIRNFDVVVFNYPEGDSVIKNLPDKNYYEMIRQSGTQYIKNNYKTLYRPVDKRDNYMKRVIGLPGDTILIVHGRAFVNNKPEPLALGSQFNYSIKAGGTRNDTVLFQKLDISSYDVNYNVYNSIYSIPLTGKKYHELIDSGYFKAIVRYENTDPTSVNHQIFPHDERFPWTEDNFGALVIPKKGSSVNLSAETLPIYERIITNYERNTLDIRNDTIFINDLPVETYTFGMNYYFMLGDNRHNSNDSRYWGFVPEDHIIGKATLVWFSIDKNGKLPARIRWKRIFRRII